MKKCVFLALALLLMIGFCAGCGQSGTVAETPSPVPTSTPVPTPTPTPEPQGTYLSLLNLEDENSLIVGEEGSFTLDFDVEPKELQYELSNSCITLLDSDVNTVNFLAIREGDCELTVTDNWGNQATCAVTVKPEPHTTYLSLPESNILFEGDTLSLKLEYDLPPQELVPELNGDCVEIVESDIQHVKVKAVSGGTTELTVTDNWGNQATSLVTVKQTESLMDLVNAGTASVAISCGSIDWATVTVKNLSDEEISFTATPGTFLSANSTSYQNMLLMETCGGRLSAGESRSYSLDTCCMNRTRHIPEEGNGFSLSVSSNQLLQRLSEYCQNNSTTYAVRQAATWIITDNATYRDCGILSYSGGRSVISQEAYDTAQELIATLRAAG